MQQFMATTESEWQKQREQELELAAATASIMQPEQLEQEQYVQVSLSDWNSGMANDFLFFSAIFSCR